MFKGHTNINIKNRKKENINVLIGTNIYPILKIHKDIVLGHGKVWALKDIARPFKLLDFPFAKYLVLKI